MARRYPTGREEAPKIDIIKARDNLELEGARRLGRVIMRYWRDRHFDVPGIAIVKSAIDGARQEYVVRSDMVNGIPVFPASTNA